MTQNPGIIRGGYTISYIPWESQLSGEVGGYPQALLKVVNLQGMLNFHRNFDRSQRNKSRGRVDGGLLEYAWNYICIELKQKQRWPEPIEKVI